MSKYNVSLQSVSCYNTVTKEESYSYRQSELSERGNVTMLRCSVSLKGMFTDEWFKVTHKDEGSFNLPANFHVVLSR